jgi:flagellar protein FliO/FliZ
MFETLFGSEMPLAARFFIAFLVVLALIGATAWLVRRFGANRLGGAGARGRQPRLAVIDAATVDGRRRLVLIRRDNIEHLLMIGGPTDLVVEPNIVRAVGSREVTREPARLSNEPTTRPAPAVESSWPLQPISEPSPVAAPRPYRTPATEEPWHAPEPGARARPADSLTGLAAELSSRLNPPDLGMQAPRSEQLAPRSEPALRSEQLAPRNEPAPRVNAPAMSVEPAAPAQNDHNLAEMAQQLEAALRRTPDNRPPVTDPQALPVNAPSRAPARDYKARVEPKFETKPEPKFDTKFEPKFDAKFDFKPEPRLDSPAPATPGKNLYENLEEEMASLLGRPQGKP